MDKITEQIQNMIDVLPIIHSETEEEMRKAFEVYFEKNKITDLDERISFAKKNKCLF